MGRSIAYPSSCPALCRASTTFLQPESKTSMAGSSTAMTKREVAV